MRILLIEDDSTLGETVVTMLHKHGFVVDFVESAKKVFETANGLIVYDLVLLDLILPDADGKEVFEWIKGERPDLPVIALTALSDEGERIEGIEQGFDDYISKPFDMAELVARLRVFLRRQAKEDPFSIKLDALLIYPEKQEVFYANKRIELTTLEFRLLLHLATNQGQSYTARDLLVAIWDSNTNASVAKVMTTISRIRRKFGDMSKNLIQTTDLGYRIE